MTLPRFLVAADALCGQCTVLTGAELHHLRVRRLRLGSEIIVADGIGHQRRGTVVALDRRHAVIRLNEEEAAREPSLQLTLALALLKGDKLDFVVEKATELGVRALTIFTCERSPGHASAARSARWERVARSAAKQCQRSTVPAISGPLPFDAVLSSDAALRLLFSENALPGGLSATCRNHPRAESVLAVVGPEGGFTEKETQQATAAGVLIMGLTPRILRAETAAIVAVTLCEYLWGDLGRRAF